MNQFSGNPTLAQPTYVNQHTLAKDGKEAVAEQVLTPGGFPDPQVFAASVVQDLRGTQAYRAPTALAAALTRNPSEEFRSLIRNYCAMNIAAMELSQVNWDGLARRLGTQIAFLSEAAAAMDTDGSLWQEVIHERIRKASANRIFRDSNWEDLEASAQAKLKYMMDRGLIRDVGELLAVSSTARRANTVSSPVGTPPSGGSNMTQVNLNFGAPTPEGDLPAAGTTMRIDLNHRAAEALAKASARPQQASSGRVIDGQMISADELRNLLIEKATEPLAE